MPLHPTYARVDWVPRVPQVGALCVCIAPPALARSWAQDTDARLFREQDAGSWDLESGDDPVGDADAEEANVRTTSTIAVQPGFALAVTLFFSYQR